MSAPTAIQDTGGVGALGSRAAPGAGGTGGQAIDADGTNDHLVRRARDTRFGFVETFAMRLRPLPRFAAASAALLALGTALPAAAQDPTLGRSLAATCANCHGTTGNAKGDMKPLAGMSSDKLLAMIADFKSGALPATIMHQIAKGYTDEQMKRIAAFFAAQTPGR